MSDARESIPELVPTVRAFVPGELVASKYRVVRQIGEGAMGTVWLAHNVLLDIDVAIKLMRIDNPRTDPGKLYQRLLQEARAAARLGHPAIVRVFDFGRTEDRAPFIVMELLRGELLADMLDKEGPFPVSRCIQMMLPIADALATAHGRGIVHRDIKPENIFIAADEYGRLQPKIVDFGVARFAEGGRTLTRQGALMGTPDYMSPEQARGEADVSHLVDVWALCVMLYEMMVGRRPFGAEGANYLAVLRAIVHDPVRPITDYGIGDSALWLILERGLRKRPHERWDTMRVLGEALALWLYERGIREDAYGASLKTTWLQSGIDGVKIETGSVAPPPNEPPRDPAASERETIPAPEPTMSHPRRGRHPAWVIVSLAVAGLLIALAIFVLRYSPLAAQQLPSPTTTAAAVTPPSLDAIPIDEPRTDNSTTVALPVAPAPETAEPAAASATSRGPAIRRAGARTRKAPAPAPEGKKPLPSPTKFDFGF